ncbi:amino acid adenylation domain-containing protein [Kibdelosporangium philippinense]|uniref:Amino acid adenylation domain-containing protein n=1 Tax=Kibdelosporangium philippinense TaxID=211113 RepID=A0ABS8Z4I7_9PSEU|nr:non-ribosomal peptide synthetase [Kibdelosporangium philippinense]MCE7002317.1 amino acid adenylation domain-containing protein [Kibdelosporangium philippinense]
MTDVSDRIAVLSPQRQELLAALRRKDANAAKAASPGPRPRGTTEPAPLSYAQRRLWFVDQLGGSVAYSAPVVHRIKGPLDVPALADGLRQVITRHESLRTLFPERDGEPVQLVAEIAEPVIAVRSVEHLPFAEREQAAQDLLHAEVDTPFDLSTGPVMRATAIRLTPEDHIFVLNIHHITSDQISMGVLVRELAECYTARTEGREPVLTELPVTYSDYAVWQRELMSGQRLVDGMAFWEKQLAGLSTLDVPTDRPRPARMSNKGAETALWLRPEIIPALRQTGAASGTSPFMTLLAAFVALLSRYTGEEDIAVGTTSAGRETEEVASLIGFFVNTLVLRTDLSGDPTFEQLLARVKQSVLDSHAHADVPFDLIVEQVHPVRDPSRPPLTPVLFQQDNTPDCALALPGLDVRLDDDFDPGTAKYDLLVSVRVWDHAARVHLQYNTELFDLETVERFLRSYEALLEAAIANPATPVTALPVLPADQAETVLREWNNTGTEPLGPECLHQMFERHVDARPSDTAVVAGGRHYTFAEIDAKANQLAHHLRARGVTTGSLVAIHLPMGVDYVIGVQAILKAGAAFVPIDPEYPTARIEFILSDSAVPVIITTAGRLTADATIVEIDGKDAQAIASSPSSRPQVTVEPEDTCYVIFTSGSTGTPKGVVLRHRGVANNLNDLHTRFAVGSGDSVLALSSPSFDMSVYEIIGVPGAGGTVILPEPELARDPAHWVDLINDYGVTLWNSAPALLDLLLTQVEQSADIPPSTLRLALLGGDWVPVTMPDRLRAFVPELEFISLGGATEASIHSIIYPVDAVDPKWTAIPYGWPMANQEAYILDDNLQPVPIGVPGELHLGGIGVASGYLNRPELTESKFVDRDGRIIYKTGDLARWRADGVIELLGRKDFMVKVNGLRIELGEIESVLRGHDAVAEAVVMARTDSVGDRHLVGYVLSESGVQSEELRALVESSLPSYMVPSGFVVLDEFPLSHNGKVDRKALAQHGGRRAVVVSEPPSGPLEERIAEAWRSVLGVTELNRTDDFFAVGGDSFKAVRVARLIDNALPVIAVFRNPTIEGLAQYVTEDLTDGVRPLIHRLTPDRPHASINLVCVPYGGGNAVAYQPLADALDETFVLWSVDLPGHDLSDLSPLESIQDVTVRCAEEIREKVTGPVVLYGQCAGVATTLLLARQLESIGVPVVATFMGAVLPDLDPERSWRMVKEGTEDQLLQHMRRLGGFDGALDEEDIVGILRVVRHDLAEMVQLWLRELDVEVTKVSGPVHCIVGDDDPATGNFETRYVDWGRYGSATSLSVVRGGGHYFCKHRPAEVAAIVKDKLRGGRSQ